MLGENEVKDVMGRVDGQLYEEFKMVPMHIVKKGRGTDCER